MPKQQCQVAETATPGSRDGDATTPPPHQKRSLSFSHALRKVAGRPAKEPTPPWASAEVELFNSGKHREALTALGLDSRRWQAAAFLHRTQGLDMQQIGELLGKPESVPLMIAYVHKLDVSGLTLEQALRALLRGFRLPGEAQKIDRILETFSRHWHASCRDDTELAAGLSADSAYILSFAIIMLNTDQVCA